MRNFYTFQRSNCGQVSRTRQSKWGTQPFNSVWGHYWQTDSRYKSQFFILHPILWIYLCICNHNQYDLTNENHAVNILNSCDNQTKTMQLKFPEKNDRRNSGGTLRQKISQRYPKDILNISQRHLKDIPKISQRYPKETSKISSNYPQQPASCAINCIVTVTLIEWHF